MLKVGETVFFTCKGSPIIYKVIITGERNNKITWRNSNDGSRSSSSNWSINTIYESLRLGDWTRLNTNKRIE